jgi:hypothetical protein
MQSKESIREEKSIIIDIKVTRWTIVYLIGLIIIGLFLGLLVVASGNAVAAPRASTNGMRHSI